jgi:hypothetical protein
MTAHEAAQLPRDGEGHNEMVAWQFPLKLFSQPLPGFMMLSCGTMAVAAGTEDDCGFFTSITTVDCHAAIFGTAGNDGLDYLAMIVRKVLREFFQVCCSKLPEDFSDGSHNRLLS